MVSTSVHFPSIAEALRPPVDITLPYGAHMSLTTWRGGSATDRRDFGTGAERARDRSIYPPSGSGVSFAGGGARRGECGATETASHTYMTREGKGLIKSKSINPLIVRRFAKIF